MRCLVTDDDKIICGHKVVLESASPYFHAMFKNCEKKSTSCYYETVSLQTSNLLQLQEVKEAFCDFLQAQMFPKNCIAINALADLHSCTKLLTSSKLYIQHYFSDVVEGDEFLSLSSEQMVKLIACDELEVPSEEKVFESVIQWVKYDLGARKCILPQFVEHVRLPLTSKDYILKKIVEEPLVNNCLKSKNYVIEALHFHLLKSDELVTIPHHIRTKPRQPAVGGLRFGQNLDSTEWYDPKINQWQPGPQIIASHFSGCLAVVKDNFVGVSDGNICLNGAEVFDCRTHEWHLVSNMTTRRSSVGIGELYNFLFVVGSVDGLSKRRLNSVECYHSSLDKWTPVTKMRVHRSAVDVGVVDGVVYALDGTDGFKVHKCVEAYRQARVAVLNGLLYVVGGDCRTSRTFTFDSVEFYIHKNKTWTMVTTSCNDARTAARVVAFDRPQHFKTC
ncbi:kelch-like protein 2 [Acyrthosiphon pisum]|uniref:BTB domain-containing protein n=1 Tax=Acyrthosiphon pisum TaxID=7029 RepID=A0A8R2JWY2_ACYPI|nr:kelch-like protein 2 [Acyrthosiphon pisum]